MDSVEVERSHPRALLVAGTLVLVAILAGCDLLEDSGTDESEQTCGDRNWCYDEDNYIEGAYDPSISRLYCYVAQVRQWAVEGEIHLDDLPDWADRDYRNDAPIIIDFATIENHRWAQRAADLREHFNDINPLDSDQIDTCSDELTQRDIESTDGKRRAG